MRTYKEIQAEVEVHKEIIKKLRQEEPSDKKEYFVVFGESFVKMYGYRVDEKQYYLKRIDEGYYNYYSQPIYDNYIDTLKHIIKKFECKIKNIKGQLNIEKKTLGKLQNELKELEGKENDTL